MTVTIGRRDLLAALGGAAAAWPLAARAQQAGKLPRVGYLSDEGATPHLFHSQDSVLKGLRERGYADGRNIVIEYRYAAGKAESLPSLATDLVSIPVDLIVTIGSPAARAAISTTRTIPIVMARVGDPVAYGLVASVARPGGNATAVSVFTHDLAAKRVEVLKDEVPGLDRLAVLHDPSFPPGQIELQQITAAAASLKVQIHAVGVRSLAALDGALPEIMKESPQALFVGSAAWFEDNPRQIVDFALKTRLPALYIRREYVEIGGIISYGIDYGEMYRNAANYIARVLRGENPGELPVLLPTKIELVINLRSAKTIDLAITSPLLIRADEVIE